MTAAQEGGESSAARPGRTLQPGKTRYPFYRRLGGPQGQSGRAVNLVPTGIFFKYTFIDPSLHKLHWLHVRYLSNVLLTYCPCVSDCIVCCVTVGPSEKRLYGGDVIGRWYPCKYGTVAQLSGS